MPKILLEALGKLPNCRVEILPRYDYVRGQLLPGLHTSSSLVQLRSHTSLLYRFGVMIESKDQRALQQLGQVLASCRRLRSLAIYAYGRLDYTGEPFTSLTTVRWLSSWTDTLPRLTKLELFNVCACLESSWRDWFKLIQWSHLRECRFSCAYFVLNGSSALAHISSLSLHLDSSHQNWGACCPTPHSVDAVRLALHTFHSLEILRLRNATKVVDVSLLARLGKTLRRLDTREDCGGDSTVQNTAPSHFSIELILQMGSYCPHLRDLVVDAPNFGQEVCQSHAPPNLRFG